MAKRLAIAAVLLAPAGASFLRKARSDACSCVNWVQAYKSGGAKCGDGHEFYAGTAMGMNRFLARLVMGGEFCESFYKRLDDDACVNMVHDNKPDAWDGGQWCYVSAECATAGAANGTRSLRVKQCKRGEDEMLRDREPEELIAWAKEHDFETGLLLKMAYPVEKEAKWPLIKDAFLDPASAWRLSSEGEEAKKKVLQKMSKLQAAGEPVIFDSKDGHPPFAVVKGSKAHLLELQPKESQVEHHPHTVTTIKCIAGCEQ